MMSPVSTSESQELPVLRSGDNDNSCHCKRTRNVLSICGIGMMMIGAVLAVTGRVHFSIQDPNSFNVASVSGSSSLSVINDSHPKHQFNVSKGSLASSSIIPTPPSGDLKFAWLMSYPNSGTSYTSKMTASVSQRMVASNYGKEHLTEEGTTPLFDNQSYDNGPYPKHTEYILPDEGYLLTKTHCGGRCTSCSPADYVETVFSFSQKCSKSNRVRKMGSSNSSNRKVVVEDLQYDPNVIQKAVHLFRNPFDNVVSRFHLHYGHEKHKNNTVWLESHPRNATGFQAWCDDMDVEHKKMDRVFYADVNGLKAIPCHPEFFRYVQWHNLAFKVVEQMDIPFHILHYEDYDDDMNQTIVDLFEFLNLEVKAAPNDFHSSDYSDHFSAHQRKVTTKMIKDFASDNTWSELVNRYKLSVV